MNRKLYRFGHFRILRLSAAVFAGWLLGAAVPSPGWGPDGHKLAREPRTTTSTYCFASDSDERSFCAYDIGNGRLDKGESKRAFTVDEAYLDLHGDRVQQRIVKAGVRLGALLNEIFDPELPPE